MDFDTTYFEASVVCKMSSSDEPNRIEHLVQKGSSSKHSSSYSQDSAAEKKDVSKSSESLNRVRRIGILQAEPPPLFKDQEQRKNSVHI